MIIFLIGNRLKRNFLLRFSQPNILKLKLRFAPLQIMPIQNHPIFYRFEVGDRFTVFSHFADSV